ncbi:olee1-like protein [Phtheirospermum japonicum]|uniref:Olee1-like protein n=1 Tax=Phtheirospermum japonicum TaxID=374723 RepID=A0A830BY41_9LAMI|nr:olee1-like protein [Phtheirospermum japonicum]
MASLKQIAILFAGALCLVSFFGSAHSAEDPQFYVEGEVYCEVCRTNFINRLSEPMAGATVRLECRGEEKGNLTYTLEGVTGADGKYKLTVDGDHADEDCAVTLVKSSRPDCQEIPDEGWATKPTAKVTLTTNSGFHGDSRHANPLGFTKKKAVPECVNLLKELQINPDEF